MNGATADPWLKIINIPNVTSTSIIGNNQYFFLEAKNTINSFKKLISFIIDSIDDLYI